MHVNLHADDHDDGHMHATPTDCSVHSVSHFHQVFVQNDIALSWALSPVITYYIDYIDYRHSINHECKVFFVKSGNNVLTYI